MVATAAATYGLPCMWPFSLFRRPKAMPVVVWLDRASRDQGLVDAVAGDESSGRHTILVAHFPAALVDAGQALAGAGLEFETRRSWSPGDTAELLRSTRRRAVAILAGALPDVGPDAAAPQPAPDAPAVAVRLVELHVLAAANQKVERFARSLPARVHVEASVSFEDPIMRQFARAWVTPMMQAMGFKPGEAIRSRMVDRAITRSLAKLAAKTTGDGPADSQQEWMDRHLRA